MTNNLVTTVNGRKAVLLYAGELSSEPIFSATYAILDGAPPERDFRVTLRHWQVDGKKVRLDAIDGDYTGDLLVINEPIKKPRGMKVWRDGRWCKF